MFEVPDAPWVRMAETYGTDYMYSYLGYDTEDEDYDDYVEDESEDY